MTIDKRVHRHLASGNYADVFEGDGRAYKLFKSGPHFPPIHIMGPSKLVFRNQVIAYQRLAYDPWLASHAPAFYGTCTIRDVIDENGNSIKEKYLLDYCYALEILDLGETDLRTGLYSNEIKLLDLKLRHKKFDSLIGAPKYDYADHLNEAEARFTMLGITLDDSSVLFHADPLNFKFIDFEAHY
jgi:hypothetical protein